MHTSTLTYKHRPRVILSKPRDEKHLRGSIYLGDLTQEWNVGQPYRRSNNDYGIFTPHAAPGYDHTFKRKIEEHERQMAGDA
jgi:hypothetical protein